MLQTQGLKTLDDLRAFLAGSQGVEIRTCEREACYAFVEQALTRFGYRRLGRAEKGLVRAYLVPEREIEFFDTSAIRAASSVAAFLVFAAHYGEWEPYK